MHTFDAALRGVVLNHNEIVLTTGANATGIPLGLNLSNHNETAVAVPATVRLGIILGNHNETVVHGG